MNQINVSTISPAVDTIEADRVDAILELDRIDRRIAGIAAVVADARETPELLVALGAAILERLSVRQWLDINGADESEWTGVAQ